MIGELKPYAEYRDENISWAHRLPSHWDIKRGKALFAESLLPVREEDEIVTCFRDGQVTLRKNRRTTGFMFALYEAGYQGVRKGQLVIHAMDAFAGAIGVSDSDGKSTPEYIVTNPRSEGIVPQYYALLLRYIAHQGFILVSCPAVRERAPRFRYPNFGDMPLMVPPPEEQAVIVRFLDHANGRLERAIRAKRKVIALLNEQKQAIIHRAVTRGLNPDAPLKPSGIPWLGDIPAHWELWRISRFARVGNGSTPSRATPAYWNGGTYPWLNSSQVNRGHIDSADQFVTDLALRECHLPKVPAGSVLVAITGQGKTRGLSAVLGIETTINQHIAYITPRIPVASPDFIHLALTAAYLQLRAASDDAGSTKGAITCEDLKRFKIAIPPRAEQDALLKKIQDETRDLNTAILRLEREIALLREYRTRLVADVVTGQLDVRPAAPHLPAEPLDDAPACDDLSDPEADDLAPEAAETEA